MENMIMIYMMTLEIIMTIMIIIKDMNHIPIQIIIIIIEEEEEEEKKTETETMKEENFEKLKLQVN